MWKTGIPAHFPSKIYHDEDFSNYYENNVFKIPSGEVVTIYNDITGRKNAEMALKESNQRFELAMRFSNDGLFDWNLQTNGIYFSPGWKKMLGYEDHEIKNEFSEWERLTKPEDVKASWVMLNELFEGKRERFEIEFQMRHKEGHWVDILSRANVVRDDDGNAVRVVGTHVNITERKRMEAALRENEKFYRDIFEKNRAMKILVDPDSGDIIDANSAACEFYQYSPKEMTAIKVWEINVLGETEIKKLMAREISGKKTDFMFEHRLASGEIRHVQVYSGPIETRGKKLLHSIVIDRTERKRSKEALKANERKYRLLTENIRDVVWVLDVETMRFQYVSPSVKRLRGYTPEEIMAVPVHHALTPEAASQIVDLANQRAKDLQTGKIALDDFFIEQVEQPCKDGSTVWTEVVTNFHINPDNKKVQVLGVTRDITDRIEAEAETKRLQDQLVQAHKMESIGTLAGGIAHNFNNILAIIFGNVELATDDVPDENPATENLEEIRHASIRAKDMVRQLLSFSRKADEKNKHLNVAPIINDSLKMLRTAIPASVEFKTHVTDEACNILGDEAQINQVVMNLVTNAAHAMSEEGLMEVTLKNIQLQEEKTCFDWVLSPGDYVILKVRDSGEGMTPETMARIFEPYYTTKDIGKGTGMGLSVVHGILKRFDGGIRVESEPSKGTLFEAYFPALKRMVGKEKIPEGETKKGRREFSL
ncbi:MAG: PAS domain S-box protein [Nitrospina sp.]|nr:PAS domain S-box protein [Nitrospina sp.]